MGCYQYLLHSHNFSKDSCLFRIYLALSYLVIDCTSLSCFRYFGKSILKFKKGKVLRQRCLRGVRLSNYHTLPQVWLLSPGNGHLYKGVSCIALVSTSFILAYSYYYSCLFSCLLFSAFSDNFHLSLLT